MTMTVTRVSGEMIEVVWNGEACMVVNKPAGLATQAPPPHESLETRLREQVTTRSNYFALPHRLDRPVSGLILVALTKKAARLLGEQFEARRVTKRYRALVEGNVVDDVQHWSDHLRKVDDEARAEVVPPEQVANTPDAKHAELSMSVVTRFDDQTLIELNPVTGRMHQLRVQSASRGHAIIGDVQYGSTRSISKIEDGCIALHAWSLEFNDPTTGRRISVTSPPPVWMV